MSTEILQMSEVLTDLVRGIPTGLETSPAAIATHGLAPQSGNMPLPVLTMDEPGFETNIELMMRYCREQHVQIAPHAKTPMSPALAQKLIDAGAWGASVANIQQAAVMLQHGIRKLIFANEVGGTKSGQRLGTLLAKYPEAECLVFADSRACLASLIEAGKVCDRPIAVLLELGAGRAGLRDQAQLDDLLAFAQQSEPFIHVKGIAVYEGSAEADSESEKVEKIKKLLSFGLASASAIKDRLNLEQVIFTAGGSSYFDLVCDAVHQHGDSRLTTILRSGAIFFFDHGVYEKALIGACKRNETLASMAAQQQTGFQPVLRVWAEVLANPEPGLYICSMGKRDVSHDLDLPRVCGLYREGRTVSTRADRFQVTQLNDQHAFIQSDEPMQIGDILEFGISHPCTCLDKWSFIYGIKNGSVVNAYQTYFG